MSDRSEAEIRRIAVEAIQNHLAPLTVKVDNMDKTLRSLYRNGSGGPPGYLETAREEDDRRYKRLEQKVESHGRTLDKLDDFVDTSNRRQKEQEERKKLREARFDYWLPKVQWAAGIILAALMGLGGWTLKKIVPEVEIIVREYIHDHPQAERQLKNLSTTPSPRVYADMQQDQDANSN
jgi:hypothetical protein